jgi:histidinol phosphatase-like enzyme
MVVAAAAELGIDVAGSWMVGDSERDVEAAVAGGVPRGRCLRLGGQGQVDWVVVVEVIVGERGNGQIPKGERAG